MSIINTTTGWDWIVKADADHGEKETAVSPEGKLVCSYRFWPVFDGTHHIKAAVTLNGSYDLAAKQVGAGGRWAHARISVESRVKHRGKTHTFQQTIFEKKVTKSSDAGPFKHQHLFIADVDLVGGGPKSETVIEMRVVLLANVKWNGSRATLDFRKADGAGIKYGPCTVTPNVSLSKPKPSKPHTPGGIESPTG
jgi:hypothetical protein